MSRGGWNHVSGSAWTSDILDVLYKFKGMSSWKETPKADPGHAGGPGRPWCVLKEVEEMADK